MRKTQCRRELISSKLRLVVPSLPFRRPAELVRHRRTDRIVPRSYPWDGRDKQKKAIPSELREKYIRPGTGSGGTMTQQLNSTYPLHRAKVEWWDKSDVFVRCPNCEEIHLHHFDGLYNTPLQRRSDCAIPGRESDSCVYKIIFPFDEISGHAGYEIDKQRAIFVSGTANPTEYYRARDDDHLGPTVDDFRDRKKWTEATEKVHISEADSGLPGGYTIERIDKVVSALVEGRVGEVRSYLESSKDADILLHGVEAHSVPQLDDSDSYSDGSTDGTKPLDDEIVQVTGNTALHFAACEASYEMVRLLLQKGANPDAVNMDGRVPLMEAALWGRLRNVELLLEYGANKQIDCACHGQRLRAVDFARPLRNNSKERYCRTRGVYKEDAYQRDLDRKKIVRLLSESLEERLPILSGFAFTRSPEDENLLTLISNFDIPNKWKTVAVLYRGSQLPTVAAMSGWAHEGDSNVQVGGREWTLEVRHLCNLIGYSLPSHERDQGDLGQYYACHAEKQLIAFFVNKHLFLPEEVEKDADIARLSLHEPSDEEYEQQEIERRRREKLSSLRDVEPSVTIKKGKILVCRPVCEDCRSFLKHVNSKLHLELTLFHRCLDDGCKTCRS